MNRLIRFSQLLLCCSALALAACSGGAKTSINPNLSGGATATNYSGPAPGSADVQSFKINLWANINGSNRCGNCHKAGGQSPMFARLDDVNQAYSAALQVVNLTDPDQSLMVTKVAGGHNCWLTSNQACADILTTWIRNWAGGATSGGNSTQIQLVAPADQAVGPTKTFPADSALFASTVYPLLTRFCSRCHSESASTPQAPYFASTDVNAAYAAAQAKINLDDPTLSRFYVRLATESHNCWVTSPGGSVDCPGSAQHMLDAIQAYANGITAAPVDPTLVVSRALTLGAGTIASGGSRDDASVIARWMFKEGTGTTAFDTSGVDPSLDLTLSGDTSWVGGWGINFGPGGGKAQGTTATSRKLFDKISATGEYSIELWAAPANVAQTQAYMASYSGGTAARNFTLAQNQFQYQALGRSTSTDGNGAPALVSSATGKFAQASLQHIVVTYDPTNGRRLYVNGNFTKDLDTKTGGALSNWDSTFAFLLGNETSGDRPWQGVIRFAAVHDRALTLDQIQQNFAAGVGERYFLLFNVSALTGMNASYVMFEVSRYDSYSYLFAKPTFISLDSTAQPGNIPISGMRIGINGHEASTGQAYSTLDATVTNANYSPTKGQLLSPIGTVIALEKGPASDMFFLSFARIGSHTRDYAEAAPVAVAPVDLPAQADVGVRTFDEINASMSAMTGVATTDPNVNATYQAVQQQLPTVPDLQGFLASQQIGVAQLAIQYCDTLVENPATAASYFPGVDFTAPATSAFDTQAGMDLVITPLINKAVGTNLLSQPSDTQLRTELYDLMGKLRDSCTSGSCLTGRTKTITKAACAAVLGSAAMLIK